VAPAESPAVVSSPPASFCEGGGVACSFEPIPPTSAFGSPALDVSPAGGAAVVSPASFAVDGDDTLVVCPFGTGVSAASAASLPGGTVDGSRFAAGSLSASIVERAVVDAESLAGSMAAPAGDAASDGVWVLWCASGPDTVLDGASVSVMSGVVLPSGGSAVAVGAAAGSVSAGSFGGAVGVALTDNIPATTGGAGAGCGETSPSP
jgi:hypothetical protein